jgi:hypothetical protein
MIDTDNDSLISEEELSVAVKAFFQSDDINNRGNWLFGDWRDHRFN